MEWRNYTSLRDVAFPARHWDRQEDSAMCYHAPTEDTTRTGGDSRQKGEGSVGLIRRGEREAPTDPFSLDQVLMRVSAHDYWTTRDACEGVQIFGGIGSGKTSGSGYYLAHSFLASGFGGLVCCAKPDERATWERYAAACGRTQELIIVSPHDPRWRFNFLDYELRRPGLGGGMTENIVALFNTVKEIVEGKQSTASGEDFWDRSANELLRNAVDLFALAGRPLSLDALVAFIADAPQSIAEAESEAWARSSFCAEVIIAASKHRATPRQEHDFQTALRYWLKSYPALADRTRTSIVATFTSVADVLLHGIAWELLATETTFIPEHTFTHGAIIVLDVSVQEYNELGRIVQGIFKYMFQRAILRRAGKEREYPRPVFLWADESQNFVSSFDFQYQAVARSARACTVYLTQNISNYYSALGSAQGKDQANALLGNFQTKIFHANTDHPTNQYAAETIAQHEKEIPNFSHSPDGGFSVGTSQQLRYKVPPEAFTTLRKGGPEHNKEVDAIFFQGGRVWRATGDTFIGTTFKQQ